MKLGIFSLSLNVKDLQKSKIFYENLGFKQMGGNLDQNYLIMKNEKTLIGLFQGMFEGNILTFNPGWDENAQEVNPFDDVRFIQSHLQNKDFKFTKTADPKTKGQEHIIFQDPDGNVIMIDQHR